VCVNGVAGDERWDDCGLIALIINGTPFLASSCGAHTASTPSPMVAGMVAHQKNNTNTGMANTMSHIKRPTYVLDDDGCTTPCAVKART
jgi:hypothetical protein